MAKRTQAIKSLLRRPSDHQTQPTHQPPTPHRPFEWKSIDCLTKVVQSQTETAATVEWRRSAISVCVGRWLSLFDMCVCLFLRYVVVCVGVQFISIATTCLTCHSIDPMRNLCDECCVNVSSRVVFMCSRTESNLFDQPAPPEFSTSTANSHSSASRHHYDIMLLYLIAFGPTITREHYPRGNVGAHVYSQFFFRHCATFRNGRVAIGFPV